MALIVVAALILAAPPDTRTIDDTRGFSFELPADAVELPGSTKVPSEARVGSLGTWVRKLDSEEFVRLGITFLAMAMLGLGGWRLLRRRRR